MGDGSAIGGWILTAAIIAVLAGGVSQNDTPRSSTTSNGSNGRSPSAARTPVADTAAGVPGCTKVTRVVSTDGKTYRMVPVAASGSASCRLRQGNTGDAVTALQQGLLMCSNRTTIVDGTFSPDTQGALARHQKRQLDLPPTGVYGPRTAALMLWPWYSVNTKTFTGRCGQLDDVRS
jgi:hypothetical protein